MFGEVETFRNEGPLWPCGCLVGNPACRCGEDVPDLAGLIETIGNARVRFWTCKVHQRGRVEWRGDVAHCLETGCDQTSAPAGR